MASLPQNNDGGPNLETPTAPGIIPQPASVLGSLGGMDFVSMRNFAIDLINRDGQPVQLVRVTEAAPLDPTLPWRVGTGTPVIYNTMAVVSTVRLRASRSGASAPEFYKQILIPGDIGASVRYGTDGLNQLFQTDQIVFAGLTYEWLAAPDQNIYDGANVMFFSGYAHPLPDASAEG